MANEVRLIDANALRERFDELADKVEYIEDAVFHLDAIVDEIEDAPTVDAVEVVRCKDCKHCIQCKNGYVCDHIQWREGAATYREIKLDGFCSYGERREGE